MNDVFKCDRPEDSWISFRALSSASLCSELYICIIRFMASTSCPSDGGTLFREVRFSLSAPCSNIWQYLRSWSPMSTNISRIQCCKPQQEELKDHVSHHPDQGRYYGYLRRVGPDLLQDLLCDLFHLSRVHLHQQVQRVQSVRVLQTVPFDWLEIVFGLVCNPQVPVEILHLPVLQILQSFLQPTLQILKRKTFLRLIMLGTVSGGRPWAEPQLFISREWSEPVLVVFPPQEDIWAQDNRGTEGLKVIDSQHLYLLEGRSGASIPPVPSSSPSFFGSED